MSSGNNPLVSIVIPVYNGANYLSEAIDSALAQSYQNCEVLVINDGSGDGGATETIALSYGNRIRYIYKENGGVASALNKGIEMMRGDYFSWLSHDDLYTPDKVQNAINALHNVPGPTRTIIVCDLDLIDASGKTIFRPVRNTIRGFYSGREVFMRFLEGLRFGGCNMLIPRDLFKLYGDFRDLKTMQDVECWIRFMLNDCAFLFTEDRSVKTRIHDEQDGQRLRHLVAGERNLLGKIMTDHLTKLNADNGLWKALLKHEIMEGNKDSVATILQTTGKSYWTTRLKFGPYFYLLRSVKKVYYKIMIYKN